MYLWKHFPVVLEGLTLVFMAKVAILALAIFAFGGGRKCISAAVAASQITEYSLMFTGVFVCLVA